MEKEVFRINFTNELGKGQLGFAYIHKGIYRVKTYRGIILEKKASELKFFDDSPYNMNSYKLNPSW